MASQAWHWFSATQSVYRQLFETGNRLIKRFQAHAVSTDYRAWRHQFLLDRLRLGLWIAFPSFLLLAAHSLYIVLWQSEQLKTEVVKAYGDGALVDAMRSNTVVSCAVILGLMLVCLVLVRSRWGQRHPVVGFLMLSWSLNGFVDQIIGAFFGEPSAPDTLVFLAIAVLIPVHWQLHLLAQAAPIAFYAIGYPLLGLTHVGTRSIYNLFALRTFVDLFWVGLISILAVYLYERLRQSEFEAQRQLQVFLHSVSHDLQTPVMGATMLLKSVLNNSQEQITLDRSILERLLEGSDRQSTLISSLLDAHCSEIQAAQLQCAPLQLSPLVESVLANLTPILTQHEVQLTNRIGADLPLVQGDVDQLWRVFSNLLSNALKHNPNGIHLMLDAEVLYPKKQRQGTSSSLPMLRCVVQDNGVGIPPQQRQRLFELYARGSRSRYMPGLGLGLYLCRQIVQAHGGEIGVNSHPGEGATFWFTLPLAHS